MKYFKNKQQTPLWFILIIAILSFFIIIKAFIYPYILLSRGYLIDDIRYPHVIDSIPPMRVYADSWGVFDLLGVLTCFIFALFALVLAILRSYYKMSDRRIYLMATSSILFSINMLSTTSVAYDVLNPLLHFYLYWITFYFYPIPIFMLLYSVLSKRYQKWMCPYIILPLIYSVASWFMYLITQLPFSVSERNFSILGGICFGSLLFICLIDTFHQKKSRLIWILSGLWIFLTFYVLTIYLLEKPFHLYNLFKNIVILHALLFLCHMLLVNTKELFTYKSSLQLLELKNLYLLENYDNLESHFAHISQMKHEIQHHLFAIRTFLDENKLEQLNHYLSDVVESYNEVTHLPSCNNRMIQAILSHSTQRAKQNEVDLTLELQVLPELLMEDIDIVSLFMNLLDNAMESCLTIPIPKNRWIHVTLKTREPYLYISVSNARQGIIRPSGGSYRSTKKDSFVHGNGLLVVKKIAKKYNGYVKTEHTQDTFLVEVILKVLS